MSLVSPSHPIELNGATYVLTPPTLATEGLFENYLVRSAIADVVRLSASYGAAFETALRDARRDASNGYYEWGSRGWNEAIKSDKHFKELAKMVIEQEKPIDRKILDNAWPEKGVEIVETILGFLQRKNSPSPDASQANPGVQGESPVPTN